LELIIIPVFILLRLRTTSWFSHDDLKGGRERKRKRKREREKGGKETERERENTQGCGTIQTQCTMHMPHAGHANLWQVCFHKCIMH
jgi:hypothetical protein